MNVLRDQNGYRLYPLDDRTYIAHAEEDNVYFAKNDKNGIGITMDAEEAQRLIREHCICSADGPDMHDGCSFCGKGSASSPFDQSHIRTFTPFDLDGKTLKIIVTEDSDVILLGGLDELENNFYILGEFIRTGKGEIRERARPH